MPAERLSEDIPRVLAASQFAGGQRRQQLVALPALRVDRCAFLVGASARSSMPPAEALVTDETQDFGASLTRRAKPIAESLAKVIVKAGIQCPTLEPVVDVR
ncbi:MAG: hypothetical protein WBV90_10125 [Terrimicrobiaceae bacterium]